LQYETTTLFLSAGKSRDVVVLFKGTKYAPRLNSPLFSQWKRVSSLCGFTTTNGNREADETLISTLGLCFDLGSP